MGRFLIAAALALAPVSSALAQDMPLSQILIDGEGWKKVENPGTKPKLPPSSVTGIPAGIEPNWSAVSPDGGTLFTSRPNSRFLYAMPLKRNGMWTAPQPYAELRTRRGENTIKVTDLLTDRDGRIYAATELGVQVFDPTGRLCGVLTPAAPGQPEHLTFEEGAQLTLWIGDTKYARKLRTQGTR